MRHDHDDHIDGSRRKDGSLVSPKARVMVPEPEHGFWIDDGPMNTRTENRHRGLIGASGAARRRLLLGASGAATLGVLGALEALRPSATHAAEANEAAAKLLRTGGVVIAFRHALAPGTFDPPGFRLEDCSTQRNLSDEGRAQARRIGAWFRSRSLTPARVRTSPWCRCVDTATLAFGHAESWGALGSPHLAPEEQRARQLADLRRALATVPAGRFEAWVTHQFVLQDLADSSTAQAEALVLRAAPQGAVEVLARTAPF